MKEDIINFRRVEHNMEFLQLATDVQSIDWGTVIVQSLLTIGAIFGGAGYWQYRQTKLQAKRDEESKKNGVEKKVDDLSGNVLEVNNKVDTLTEDMQDLKKDLILLQQANEATVKYRKYRDEQDKVDSRDRKAIIGSLCGMMRERLLDNYKRCIKKGYYSKEEREIYGAMFECYENEPFNGDGVMHDLRPIMKNLPWNADDPVSTDDDELDDL